MIEDTIENTIEKFAILISQGAPLDFLKALLLADGVAPKRAVTIVLWAKKISERGMENGIETAKPII